MSSLKVLDYKLKRPERMDGTFILETDGMTLLFRSYVFLPNEPRLVLYSKSWVASAIIVEVDTKALVKDLIEMGVPTINDDRELKQVVN